MAKRYARLNWNSTTTYVSAENLNKMDKGIDDCDNAIEVLNEGLNTVNNNLTLLNDTLSSFISVPDDTDFNSLTQDGWYSIYTTLNAPTTDVKNRWLVHVENIKASGVSIIVHTAFFYMGGTYVSRKTRHVYYVISSSTWSWSPWS